MDAKRQKEFRALINLLDEPDLEMFNLIEKQIISHGYDILPFILEATENYFHEDVIHRIKTISEKINFDHISSELLKWKQLGAVNLFHGLYLIAAYRYILLDFEKLKNEIAAIQHDIWMEMNLKLTLLEKIRVFNHVFYEMYGFDANKEDFHNPSNSLINDVVHFKKGNPISLGALYLIIARNIGLPVYGVNVPEHFVCVVVNEGEEDSMSFLPVGEPLFYINAFNKGSVFTKNQLSAFLVQIKVTQKPEYFLPCSNLDIVIRVLNNLSFAYQKLKDTVRREEVEMLKRILE